ncbi:MAG: response regulator [Chitinophagaceae bacterium]
MSRIKVGIVEDEMVIALTIESTLHELGYTCCGPAASYGEALEMMETDKPDLILLDINLAGKKDGIDVAEKLNILHPIPFIFLTANSDLATIERAKAVKPHAYIVKPFNKDELFAAIEIAFSNYTVNKEAASLVKREAVNGNDFVFLKDGKHFHRVHYAEILYLESENNYTSVFLNTRRKLMIRRPFADFLESLPPAQFARVQRSYAVNTTRIDSLEMDDVTIAGVKIPISKSYRASLMKVLGIQE